MACAACIVLIGAALASPCLVVVRPGVGLCESVVFGFGPASATWIEGFSCNRSSCSDIGAPSLVWEPYRPVVAAVAYFFQRSWAARSAGGSRGWARDPVTPPAKPARELVDAPRCWLFEHVIDVTVEQLVAFALHLASRF